MVALRVSGVISTCSFRQEPSPRLPCGVGTGTPELQHPRGLWHRLQGLSPPRYNLSHLLGVLPQHLHGHNTNIAAVQGRSICLVEQKIHEQPELWLNGSGADDSQLHQVRIWGSSPWWCLIRAAFQCCDEETHTDFIILNH